MPYEYTEVLRSKNGVDGAHPHVKTKCWLDDIVVDADGSVLPSNPRFNRHDIALWIWIWMWT